MLRLVLLALFCTSPALAQNCSRAVSQAQSSYQSGDFDGAIARLTRCLDAGRLEGEQRRQAYRLIGLSYIGKDREAEARQAVARLLDVAPNYQPDPNLDPPPFVRMVEDVRRRRGAGGSPGASSRSTLSLALRGHGLAYSDTDDDSFAGGGGDVTIGYRLSRALEIVGHLSGSAGDGDLGTVTIGQAGLGLRYHIGEGRIAPFVGASAIGQAAEFEVPGFGSVGYAGAGGEVEGGVRYALSPSLALEAGASAAFASLSTDARAGSITSTVIRFGGGVAWRP